MVRTVESRGGAVCLVSMPFHPVCAPALGPSLLKSVLAREGIHADVEYGSLRLLRLLGERIGLTDAVRLYEIVATTGLDPGELFLSDALWSDDRRLFAGAVRAVLRSRAAASAHGVEERRRLAGHAEQVALCADELLERTYAARHWDRYDVVGFSSTFAQNVSCLALARRIHARHPGVHVVFGGANCGGGMGLELLRSFPQVHSVVRGEGETTLPGLVRAVRARESLAHLPGVAWREGGQVHEGPPAGLNQALDALPAPDFDDYFRALGPELRDVLERTFGLRLAVETARGCWWGAVKHCVFCGLNRDAMPFRSKSPERAAAELRALRDRYGISRFHVVDNILDHRYLDTLLPALEDEGMRFFLETKANLDEDEVRQLARAGVQDIQPGIEALSSELLTLMQKGVPAYRNVELLKWCAMHRVRPHWYYLFGFAREPDAVHLACAALMPRLAHLPPPLGVNNVKLDRGSPYFERWQDFGFRSLRPVGFGALAYRGLEAGARERLAYHFTAELPQGNGFAYVPALHAATEAWRRRHAAGAFLEQHEGDAVTLVLDGREETRRAYLLTGRAHVVHRRTRRAAPVRALAALDAPVARQTSARDARLFGLGRRLDAEPIGDDTQPDPLAALVARGLLLEMDGRLLALALDPGAQGDARPGGSAFVPPPESYPPESYPPDSYPMGEDGSTCSVGPT